MIKRSLTVLIFHIFIQQILAMKIAIIGAGPSGLTSAKNAIVDGHEVDVYEQTNLIGGTWVFTEEVGFDNHGIPVHSSMYEGLITNIPKELMEFEKFSYPDSNVSYIPHRTVLEYLEKYTNHFHLYKNIKLNHHVININPIQGNKWNITFNNLNAKKIEEIIYDAVMICSGHFFQPFIPKIPGQENFQGISLHSHTFRHANDFRNKTIIILGAKSSGTNIAKLLNDVAQKVYISFTGLPYEALPDTVITKERIVQIGKNSVQFSDGSEANVDVILYCTGYINTFPFISKDSGIEIDDNWVKPLYKHVINIKNPTMAIIGITVLNCPFPVSEYQAKFFLAYLKGNFKKTTEQMQEEYNEEIRIFNEKGLPKKYFHLLGKDQGLYLDNLADIANIKRIRSVVHRLYMFAKGAHWGRKPINAELNQNIKMNICVQNNIQMIVQISMHMLVTLF